MQLHPDIATALTAERESELLRRGAQQRLLTRPARLVEPIRLRRRLRLRLVGRSA